MKKSIPFISFIFLFSFLLFNTLLFTSSAVSYKTDYYAYNQQVIPETTNWSYIGRNGYDWMNFSEGASPYFSLPVSPEVCVGGVFRIDSDIVQKYMLDDDIVLDWYNDSDQVYLLECDDSPNSMFVMIPQNVYDGLSYMSGYNELLLLHVVLPTSSGNPYIFLYTDGGERFQSFINYTLSGGWGSTMTGHMYYYNGSINLEIGNTEYHYDAINNRYYFFYYILYEWNMPSGIWVKVYELTSYEGITPKYGRSCTFHSTVTAVYRVYIKIQQYNVVYQPLFIFEYDSSLFSLYSKFRLLKHVLKTIVTNSYQSVFSYQFPTYSYMEWWRISAINISDSIPVGTFLGFVVEMTLSNVSGSAHYLRSNITTTPTIILINSELGQLTSFQLNTKYRTISNNPFNNTIYINVTYMYIEVPPTLTTIALFIIPSMLILVVPSGIASIKFGRTGFLVVFFIMTLILTAIQVIPIVPGLLMLAVLVVIFLKLLKQSEGDS